MTSLPALPPDSTSPSPSLPFRPFSRLPTELVQHITESTVPLSFHSKTFTERQTTLRSVALVSRLFYQIAQPILLAVVKLASRTQHDMFEHKVGNNGEASWTTELVVQGSTKFFGHHDARSRLVSHIQLRLIVLCGCVGGVKLDVLEGLANLRVLRLYNLIIHNSSPFVLPRVEELILLAVETTSTLLNLLKPSALPSLLALALWSIADEHYPELEAITFLLIDRLEMISLDVESLERFSPATRLRLDAKTLFDHDFNLVRSLLNVASLRLHSEAEVALEQVEQIRNIVRNTVSPVLSLLYLAPDLEPAPHQAAMKNAALRSLEVACAERKIDIVYEEQPQDWTLDSGVSMDFWRRMKERKAKGGG